VASKKLSEIGCGFEKTPAFFVQFGDVLVAQITLISLSAITPGALPPAAMHAIAGAHMIAVTHMSSAPAGERSDRYRKNGYNDQYHKNVTCFVKTHFFASIFQNFT
jgi:hypothetical protein